MRSIPKWQHSLSSGPLVSSTFLIRSNLANLMYNPIWSPRVNQHFARHRTSGEDPDFDLPFCPEATALLGSPKPTIQPPEIKPH